MPCKVILVRSDDCKMQSYYNVYNVRLLDKFTYFDDVQEIILKSETKFQFVFFEIKNSDGNFLFPNRVIVTYY